MPYITTLELGQLRHKLANDRTVLNKVVLHLRDAYKHKRDVNWDVVNRVIDETINFNCDHLGATMDLVDNMILKRKRVKK